METRPSSDTDVARLLQAALAAQRQGRHDEAARHYAQVLARQPEQPQALNALGMIALQRGEHEVAREKFARATAADPAAAQLWMNLASAARALGDDAGEEAALRGALAIEQRQLIVQLRLAELMERTGQRRQAATHWSAVIALGQQEATPSAELRAVLDRAHQAIAGRTETLATALDEALAPARAAHDRRDLRRIEAGIDGILGRRRIYQNECHGVHFPFLPADEFFDQRHFPWAAEIEAQTKAIRAELLQLITEQPGSFTPYVEMEPGTPTNLWSKLDHSLDWSALHLWRHGERNDALAARCPITTAALAKVMQPILSDRSPTAFFSVLKPRTHIPPHGGVTNIRATAHLPLIVPEGCRFRVGGEERRWEPGRLFVFDDTIEHEAWNDSDEMRAVLIFDVWNPHLTAVERDLLATFFLTADAADQGELAGRDFA